MDSYLPGLILMVLLVVGLGAWIWYAMRPGKNEEKE
jgi:hypothetical protein